MKSLFFLLVILCSLLNGKVLVPDKNLLAEKLLINNKEREYYLLDNNEYIVQGPSVVSVYARMAFPKKQKYTELFSININLENINETSSILNISKTFNKKKDSRVSSLYHPMHNYTESGKVEVNIPDGKFKFIIENDGFFSKPVLLRVIQKKIDV